MDRSAELRLPTVVVPVRLCLIGQEARGAELFVADVARRGRAHLLDDLVELLDASAGFVPAHLNRPGLFVRLWTPDEQVLVNKRQIVAVAELEPPGEWG